MRMDKLTNPLQNALADAQSLAVGRDHNQIDSAHLLQALLNQQGGSARPLLQRAGANIDALQQALRSVIDGLPVVKNSTGDVHVSPDLTRVLNLSDKKAQQGGDSFVSSELVLQAFLDAGGAVGKVLTDSGVTKSGLEAAVKAVRG
ncbi:MAG: type VI secretion system ATPase TssH, partial [Congregibacter sp.]|nr:type VI secretion system ATPase TssH [Congregibacter sp.]